MMGLQGVLRLDSDGEEDGYRFEPFLDWVQTMPKLCNSLAAANRLQRLMLWDYVESPVALTGKTESAPLDDRLALLTSVQAG